ncbi:MAG: PIG-L family deacetylase [Acidobacteriaceae bacterium]|nr:PIG-L family deacetylase [Acidobacteriaceae bacterium]
MRNSLLKYLSAALFSVFFLKAQDQANPQPDERFKADLLVVVAHPDDETEIGAYLARAIFDEKKRVAVVFGTRGNTGGNAQGQEQAAALGAIREIEARRALEHFGVMNVWFLNGPDTAGQSVLHSLETWNHGDSLGRLVRLVRLTRPSVIATWLPDYVAGENHGDHQASGVLATEAFDIAADPAAYAEQITPPRDHLDIYNFTEGLHPWQAEKIYYFSDASNTDFMKGQGPTYSATDISPSRHVSYARLAAEECAFHLTQDDTGQMATKALAANDLHYFEQPVRLILGKSLVDSSTTGDMFVGVVPQGIPYHPPAPVTPRVPSQPEMELGESWRFYRNFWPAHGLDHLAGLVGPEVAVNFDSFLWAPLIIENPTDSPLPVDLAVDLPRGWTYVRKPSQQFSIGPHQTYSFDFEVRTPAERVEGWTSIGIRANSAGKPLGSIQLRVQMSGGALPQ